MRLEKPIVWIKGVGGGRGRSCEHVKDFPDLENSRKSPQGFKPGCDTLGCSEPAGGCGDEPK